MQISENKRSRAYPQASQTSRYHNCLLYTSDAADDLHCVDLGGRRIIKKKITALIDTATI